MKSNQKKALTWTVALGVLAEELFRNREAIFAFVADVLAKL